MRYSERYPQPLPQYFEPVDPENQHVFFTNEIVTCYVCRQPCRWIDVFFEVGMCSEECWTQLFAQWVSDYNKPVDNSQQLG